MTIGIPTYNRKRLITLEWLPEVFSRDEIVIATQTEADYEYIAQTCDDVAKVIYSPANCVGGNRNTILEYCQTEGIQEVVMLDDDLKAINILGSKSKAGATARALSPKETRVTLEYCAEAAKKHGAKLWGVYPVDNPFYQNRTVYRQALLTGTVLGISDTTLRFNESYRIKEDMELCCRVIAQGFNALRFNFLSANALHNSPGGCKQFWTTDWDQRCTAMLCEQYPMIVSKKTDTSVALRRRMEKI